ncbi:MAG: glutamate--tRNA ligase [Planctomycetota bacterium]|jgi:glutamyl-tRNA synthetase
MIREDTHKPVVVRVAPSPTGDPHVGTAYIALFNRALREQRGGRFILRIEDTDQKRCTPESEAMIFEALKWVGLEPDEGPGVGGEFGPYRQSERSEIYRAHALRLVASGHAYPCFCSPERLASLREEQKARKDPFLGYDGACRALDAAEAEKRMGAGEPHVIRLKVDREGETVFRDEARGEIRFENATLDDQVLMKSDGFPTYHLAAVVDDHRMGMTHVIRAEEWISSTPKHVLLYEAFGWEPPLHLHMPILRNKNQSKISKRKNPVSIFWYRDCGYLPEALVNFLALMGYSLPPEKAPSPDNPEIFHFEDLVRELDLGRIKTSGPVFDLEKLDSFNGHYVRAMEPEALASRLLDFLAYLERNRERLLETGETPVPFKGEMAERENSRRALTLPALALADAPPSGDEVVRTLPLVRERLEGLLDYADRTAYLFTRDPLDYDPALLVDKKKSGPETAEALKGWLVRAEKLTAWGVGPLDEASRAHGESIGWKVRPLFMGLRVAVTGRKVSPPLFESMEILGRDRTLERVRDAVERLASAPGAP